MLMAPVVAAPQPGRQPGLPALDDTSVLALTASGERELREPGTTLTPAQLEVLVLIDGHATVAQLTKRARIVAPEAPLASLHEIVAKGLASIVFDSPYGALDPGDFFNLKHAEPVGSGSGSQTCADADAEAELLRRTGYCVNMARRAAERKFTDGRKLTVLLIDDDPDIGALLRKYLKLEGLDTRTATSRDEIVAAFRRSPPPDLVLLDLGLDDLDGFDVLVRMRQHPVLKEVPVIILTATATREVVIKGISCGADGHITKPFRIHPLVRAVKALLGLKCDPTSEDWDLSL